MYAQVCTFTCMCMYVCLCMHRYIHVYIVARPSPLRRFIARINCARVGHNENWDDTSHEDRRKVSQRNIQTLHTLASVQRSYRCVINARYSVVYSSLASSLFSSRKLSNGEAVTRTSCVACLSPRDVSSQAFHVFPEFTAPARPHN